MDVTLYPTRIFSHVGRVQTVCQACASVEARRAVEGPSARARREKDGEGERPRASERASVRASERERASQAARNGTEQASIERTFICASSCL